MAGLTALNYFIAKDTKESLIFFAACVAAAGQITASFYTARMLSAAIAQSQSADAREKAMADHREKELRYREQAGRYETLKYTMRFGERWNEPTMYHVRDFLREIHDFGGPSERLIELIESKKTNVIHVINFFEEIATAKKLGLIDSQVAKDSFDHIVVTSWRKLLPWIEKHRRDRNNQRIWEEFEALFDAWKNS